MNVIFSFFIQRNDPLSTKWQDNERGRGGLGSLVCEVKKKVNPKDINQFILFSFSIYCYFPFTVSSNIHFQGLDSTLSFFLLQSGLVSQSFQRNGTRNQLFGLIRLYSPQSDSGTKGRHLLASLPTPPTPATTRPLASVCADRAAQSHGDDYLSELVPWEYSLVLSPITQGQGFLEKQR